MSLTVTSNKQLNLIETFIYTFWRRKFYRHRRENCRENTNDEPVKNNNNTHTHTHTHTLNMKAGRRKNASYPPFVRARRASYC